MVQYCSLTHQSVNTIRHLQDCTRIQEAIGSVSIAEERLLEKYPILQPDVDLSTISKRKRIYFIFASWPSRDPFLGILELQESYVNALRILIATCLEVDTYLSLQGAYEQVLELHCLGFRSPGQSSGTPLEYTIPTLLFMKEDQICYTYLCFRWGRRDREVRTDIEALERLLDHKRFKKNVFGGLEKAVSTLNCIPDVVIQGAMVLLYFWWLRDLENLRLVRLMEAWLVRRLNFDIYTIIQSYMTETVVIAEDRDLMKQSNTPLIEKMEKRMRYHFRCGNYMNETFWEQMVEASEDEMVHSLVKNARSDNKGHCRLISGEQEHERKILNILYWPFRNTPGAFEYVKKMIMEEIR
ncbi:hypothetical protein TWF481_005334 [Arthrobotrys musiformis]|uniref:Uncharacterized protein n=1 Tax=Arthrobotrys musiformis TaxID=47236 RepID=A0AAV9WFG7_9PEZI